VATRRPKPTYYRIILQPPTQALTPRRLAKNSVVIESAVSTRCVRSLVAPVKPVTAVMQMDGASKMAVKKHVVTGSADQILFVTSLVAPVNPMKPAITKANVNAYQTAGNISAVKTRFVERKTVALVRPMKPAITKANVNAYQTAENISAAKTRFVERKTVALVRPMKTAIAKANVNAYQIAGNISAAKTRFVERKTVALVVLKRFARKANVALKTAPIASVVQIQIAESLVALATPVPPATALADVYPSPLAPALMAGA